LHLTTSPPNGKKVGARGKYLKIKHLLIPARLAREKLHPWIEDWNSPGAWTLEFAAFRAHPWLKRIIKIPYGSRSSS
jgi:hypothetical protein